MSRVVLKAQNQWHVKISSILHIIGLNISIQFRDLLIDMGVTYLMGGFQLMIVQDRF
jgi:hypothetical protein